MRRLGRFLLCLLSLSMLTTTLVHAQEVPNARAPTIECTGYVHSEGDADQTQGDADKAIPHHHGGCQGAPAFVPVSASEDMLPLAVDAPVFIPAPIPSKRWAIVPDLRPPIA